MANDNTELEPTAEELQAEKDAQQERKEEEVRANVISDYGFDEDTDAEKIDKLTKERMEGHEKLSTAIRQKIKHREAAKTGKTPEDKDKNKSGVAPEEVNELVRKGVLSTLEQRDLDDMDVSDEIKAEIKRVAEIRGITVKAARRDPYIVAKEDDYKRQKKADEASLSNKGNKGGGKKNWSVDTPPEVDMSTQEGRDTYEEWKKWAIGQGA